MTPTIEQMRSRIIDQYVNPKWKDRVKAMKPNQVMAVYYRMLEYGKFDSEQTLRKGHKDRDRKKPIEQYHQMTIFDYI